MADVTGSIGNQPVELDNAATEKTLREILASINRLNGTIVRGGGGSGGGGGTGGGGSGGPSSSIPAFNALNVVLGLVRGTFNFLSNVVAGLATAIGATTGLFVNIADEAIQGKLSLSSFYTNLENVASQIPIIGGLLGGVIGLFAKLAEMQEQELAAYRKLTEVGVNFGGTLTSIREAALRSYMSLDQFADLMSKNSDTFTKLGGSVNQGAEAFAGLSNKLISSQAGSYLLALGYTAEQLNTGLATYISISGYRSAKELKNSDAMIAGSVAYLEQLDGLARLTGQARKEQEDQLKAAAKNAAWQAYMATLGPEEFKKATIGMANALAVGGKGAVDAFQSRIMGIAPDEAGQKFIATSGKVGTLVEQSAEMVKDRTKSISDMNAKTADALKAAKEEFSKYSKEAMFAIIRQGGPLAETFQTLGITAERFNNMTKEEILAEFEKKQLEESTAKSATDANKALMELGSSIYSALTPVINKLTPVMNNLAVALTKFVTTHMDDIVKTITQVSAYVLDFVSKLFSPEGRTEIINDLKEGFRFILQEIGKQLNITTVQTPEQKTETKKIDESNWEKMSIGEKMESGVSRGIETVGGWFSDTLKEQAEGARIRRETEYLKNKEVPGRAHGSLGTSGKLFENWGSGTIAELHGLEAVVTPEQMSDIVKNAASGAINSVSKLGESKDPIGDVLSALTGTAPKEDKLTDHIIRLNTLTEQMLTAMKETATLMKKNVDATQSLRGNLFV